MAKNIFSYKTYKVCLLLANNDAALFTLTVTFRHCNRQTNKCFLIHTHAHTRTYSHTRT